MATSAALRPVTLLLGLTLGGAGLLGFFLGLLFRIHRPVTIRLGLLLAARAALSAAVARTACQVLTAVPSDQGRRDQRGRRQGRPVPPGELARTDTTPTAGTPPPARRSGTAARRPRSRWPSRSAGCGPSPAPSSRSSPARRAPSGRSLPRVGPRAWPTRVDERRAQRAQPRARPRRLLLADDPPHLVERRRARSAPGRTASCRSAARTAARPGE